MKTNPLDHIRIASPCPADWDQMRGDNRRRFCTECKLNVYNLSEMTRDEAENFLFAAEGRVCVRLYRRRDGTVITEDCPVGWQAIKQRVSRLATAVFGLVAGFLGGLWATNQICEAYREPVEKIAAETNEDANYQLPGLRENKIILVLEEDRLIEPMPEAVVGRVEIPPLREKEPAKKQSSKSNEAIDFSINGGVSNLDELKWVITER
jgi:hypothetical protein